MASDSPASTPPTPSPPTPGPLHGQFLFVEEFVKIGKDASVFAKEDVWASASSRVIELIIRLKPEIDAYLHLTPFPHLRINDFLSGLSKRTEALKHVAVFIEKYDEALRTKKRESVQKKIEEACANLTHEQKVRYILVKFAQEHFRIYEESFSIVLSCESNDRAISKAAHELARDFIYHLSHENESVPQNLLESYLWTNSGSWRSTVRNLKSFKDHYIWDNFDFHNDEKKGFSMFDFHTRAVTVFTRKGTSSQDEKTPLPITLWARKSELEIQAEIFESKSKVKKDEKENKYYLELLRLPFDYEEDHFDHLCEEELMEGFLDITKLLEEKRLEKEMELGVEEGKEIRGEEDVDSNVNVPVAGSSIKSSSPPLPSPAPEIDSIFDKILEEAVNWPAQLIESLTEFLPDKKFTPEELEEAWKYLIEAHTVGASILTTIPWAMRAIQVEGRSLLSSQIVKSGSLHALSHVATTAGLHAGARIGVTWLGLSHVAAGALISPLALTVLPIAAGIGVSVILHMRKGKEENQVHVPLNPNAVDIIKKSMEGSVEKKKEEEKEATPQQQEEQTKVEEKGGEKVEETQTQEKQPE